MTCPTCQKQVIAGVPTCQFCGSDLRGMAPAQAKRSIFIDSDSYEPVHTGGKPGWVYPAYYCVSGYYVVSALIGILLVVLNKKSDMSDPFTIAMIAIYGVSLIVGIGLLAKIELVRGIVNYVSFGKILGALRGILFSLGIMMVSTGMGILLLLFNVFELCTAVFMIYLIGETD
jgi:hypothetical protein